MEKQVDVIVAKRAGFCPGVKRAIDKVLELEATGHRPVYTIGPLIHNKQVTDMLAEKQITTIDKPSQATDKGGVLVIRAHGITPEFQQEIENSGMEVVDATCPLVKHAQNVIAQFAQKGYHTIIVGDADHAEVIGLMGYTQGKGIVVSGPEEAKTLPHFDKVNVVSQTTQKESVFFETADEIKKHYSIEYNTLARCGIIGHMPRKNGRGKIVIATGGTSDIPVAEEAAVTAMALGNEVVRLYDVGVAGLHRTLAHLDTIMEASVIIAIAGMEGALASVLGGLASCPVIAVPTSVGYGASFQGLSALLSMLNSCASGVAVVNIDNGFGAAYMASMINHDKV